VLRLDDNYRNTDKIVANILLAVPARIGRAQVSAGADCQQFEDSADRIVKIVNKLHDGGAHWEQICVVVVGDASDVHRVLAASNIKWTSDASGDGVLVANPEYVQGLEFPHVVVYFDGSRELKSAARFYVAASRARVSLAIVDPQGVYTKLVEENLQ
jgi:DNA helicase IV